MTLAPWCTMRTAGAILLCFCSFAHVDVQAASLHHSAADTSRSQLIVYMSDVQTNAKLRHKELMPNVAARSAIRTLREAGLLDETAADHSGD